MALLTNINGKFSVSDAGAVTFNNAFTFPTVDGAANYVLQTNGSGQLAWALNGNGDISGSGTANTVTKFTGAKTVGNGPITFSGNNSTFAGDITIGPKSNASITTSESGGATTKLMSASVGRSGTFSNHEYHLMQNSAVAVTIDVNKNVTFEAPVWIPDYIYHVGDPDTYFGFSAANEFLLVAGGSNKFAADVNAAYMYYQGGVKLQTTSTGVTVNSTVSATSFLGDLNGTINTVTTATTKGNSTNDTTVATTAFVQNVVGTIPAGLVFQGTWNASTNSPTLTSGSGTTGHFYIVSVAGSTNLDGITDWQVGDWAVFIEQGASDQWEKIDNSSVLGGSGTGGSFAGWSGSGTSVTLGNAPVTFSGNNSAFIGHIAVEDGNNFYGANAIAASSEDGNYVASFGKSTSGSAKFAGNITVGAGNSTFAGTVRTNGYLQVVNPSAEIWIGDSLSGTDGGFIKWNSTHDYLYIGNSYSSAYNENIKIDNTGVVTLSDSAQYHKIQTFYSGSYTSGFKFSDYNGGIWYDAGSDDLTLNAGHANSQMLLNSGGAIALTLDASQNATFAGTIVSDNIAVGLSDGNNSSISLTANTGNWTFTNVQASRNLEISDSDGTGTVMTIDTSGDVGIGTTSPQTLLNVNSLSGTTYPTLGTASGVIALSINQLHGMYLGVDGASGNGWIQAMREDASATAYNLILQPSGGNVGISETSPDSTLTVGGNFTATTTKPTVSVSNMTSGGSLGIRGLSPILAFDKTAGGVPKILMDGGGLEFKNGTLDAQGDVHLKIDSSGNVTFNGDVTIPSGSLNVGGNATVKNMLTINIDDISTGENRGLKLYNQNSTGQQWNLTTGIVGQENTSFCIRDATNNVNAFTMAKTSGNANFAGTVETTTLRTDVINNKANSANIIYRSGTSTLVGGGTTANKLYVLDNGRVGIGVTDPDAKLEIKGTGASTGLTFKTTDSSDNEIFYIKDGGVVGVRYYPFKIGVPSGTANVANTRFQIATTGGDFVVLNDGKTGIGTTSPAYKLQVQDANAAIVYVKSTTNNQNASIWFNSNSGGTQADRWEIGTNISAGADLEFFDRLNSVSRMVIQNDGKVGIGTTSPAAKLQVNVGSAIALYAGNACGHVGIGVTSTDISGNGLQPQLTVKGNISYGYNNYSSVANTWSNALNFSGYPAGLYQVNICKQSNASAYIIAQVKWSGTAGTVINTVTSFQYGITFSGTQLQSIINTTTATSISVQCLVTFESCLP
jgi:hypothetical protein